MQDIPNETLLLFDIDNTLTAPLQPMSDKMVAELQRLKAKGYSLSLVGGSSPDMISKQLESQLSLFKYIAAENGAQVFHEGIPIMETTLGKIIGMDNVFQLIIQINNHLKDLKLPFIKSNQIDIRIATVNVAPCGRDCSLEERAAFAAYDAEHQVRKKLIEALQPTLDRMNLRALLGGQISFDIGPKGFDKTMCLQCVRYSHFPDTRLKYKNIHFFGDKTDPGGNDYELYNHHEVIGHSVENPNHLLMILKTF